MTWIVLRRGLVWTDTHQSEEECLEEIYDDTKLRKEPRDYYTHMTMNQYKKDVMGCQSADL